MRNKKLKIGNWELEIGNRNHHLLPVWPSFPISYFLFSCLLFPFSCAELLPSSHSWENCVVYSDGNALYAVNRVDSKPLWSETGLFYRETFDFDDWTFVPENKKKKRSRPTQMFAEHLVRAGRLYVVLNRSAFGPEQGNVLAAFDLTQEGKLLWRIALDEEAYSRHLRFDLIETLTDDRLTVLLSDRSVLRVDAVRGTIP